MVDNINLGVLAELIFNPFPATALSSSTPGGRVSIRLPSGRVELGFAGNSIIDGSEVTVYREKTGELIVLSPFSPIVIAERTGEFFKSDEEIRIILKTVKYLLYKSDEGMSSWYIGGHIPEPVLVYQELVGENQRIEVGFDNLGGNDFIFSILTIKSTASETIPYDPLEHAWKAQTFLFENNQLSQTWIVDQAQLNFTNSVFSLASYCGYGTWYGEPRPIALFGETFSTTGGFNRLMEDVRPLRGADFVDDDLPVGTRLGIGVANRPGKESVPTIINGQNVPVLGLSSFNYTWEIQQNQLSIPYSTAFSHDTSMSGGSGTGSSASMHHELEHSYYSVIVHKDQWNRVENTYTEEYDSLRSSTNSSQRFACVSTQIGFGFNQEYEFRAFNPPTGTTEDFVRKANAVNQQTESRTYAGVSFWWDVNNSSTSINLNTTKAGTGAFFGQNRTEDWDIPTTLLPSTIVIDGSILTTMFTQDSWRLKCIGDEIGNFYAHRNGTESVNGLDIYFNDQILSDPTYAPSNLVGLDFFVSEYEEYFDSIVGNVKYSVDGRRNVDENDRFEVDGNVYLFPTFDHTDDNDSFVLSIIGVDFSNISQVVITEDRNRTDITYPLTSNFLPNDIVGYKYHPRGTL